MKNLDWEILGLKRIIEKTKELLFFDILEPKTWAKAWKLVQILSRNIHLYITYVNSIRQVGWMGKALDANQLMFFTRWFEPHYVLWNYFDWIGLVLQSFHNQKIASSSLGSAKFQWKCSKFTLCINRKYPKNENC